MVLKYLNLKLLKPCQLTATLKFKDMVDINSPAYDILIEDSSSLRLHSSNLMARDKLTSKN